MNLTCLKALLFLNDTFVASSTTVRNYRDTRASQSLLLADKIVSSAETSLNSTVLIQGKKRGDFVSFTLHG